MLNDANMRQIEKLLAGKNLAEWKAALAIINAHDNFIQSEISLDLQALHNTILKESSYVKDVALECILASQALMQIADMILEIQKQPRYQQSTKVRSWLIQEPHIYALIIRHITVLQNFRRYIEEKGLTRYMFAPEEV